MSKPVKSRPRNSPLRREQAAATRIRIAEAAAAVFEARGYAGSRIEDVAAEAGVAYPTVYKAFRNKPNLLTAAVDAAMTGGEEGEVERQAWWVEQLEEPRAERQLRLIARNARLIYDRAGRLLEVVRAAAPADKEIDALWRRIDDDRRARSRASAKRLATKAKLRATIPEAATTLWTLSGPELYVLQVERAGLRPQRYERWLADLLVAALLTR